MTSARHWPQGRLGIDFPKFLRWYGLEVRGEPTPLTGGEDNRLARIATDKGDVVVREYARSGHAEVSAEVALLEHLAADGFPTPMPIFPESGERVALVGGNPIVVFPFVSGSVPAAMTAPLAAQCGALLARMHVSTRDWTDERIPVIDRRDILRQATASDVKLAGARFWRSETRGFLERNAEDLDLLDRLPSGPLHHDLHRRNLLVDGEEIIAVLDFDELNRGPLILDLARWFHYTALEQDDMRLPAGLAEAATSGYQSIRPLTDAELRLLPLAFDLAGIVDAAAFIMWAAPYLGLESIGECLSWKSYLANRAG
ncbi:phosphotransferase enzyme family protein [Glycomyces albidus]|uniref:Phosphotransferase n=1 Tax=Glycomyces albidus TaxID=2656774 RepID=A0A6L5GAJ8_9ACTN|nr:phosphotransferase [Glycomyces albidus]MQM26739.1 phosphotransferase [Glycomyces albidus]